MKKILLLLFLGAIFQVTFSQNFNREAGIRAGITSGFTYRMYLDDYLSYESILSFRRSGMQVSLLRQIHEEGSFLDQGNKLHFIYGLGGHLGFFFTDRYKSFGYNSLNYPQKKFTPVIGIDAYAAMEYRFDSFPIVLGMDYKPFFEFSMYQFFKMRLWDLAFTLKYRF